VTRCISSLTSAVDLGALKYPEGSRWDSMTSCAMTASDLPLLLKDVATASGAFGLSSASAASRTLFRSPSEATASSTDPAWTVTSISPLLTLTEKSAIPFGVGVLA
jgi:hypothetical protein